MWGCGPTGGEKKYTKMSFHSNPIQQIQANFLIHQFCRVIWELFFQNLNYLCLFSVYQEPEIQRVALSSQFRLLKFSHKVSSADFNLQPYSRETPGWNVTWGHQIITTLNITWKSFGSMKEGSQRTLASFFHWRKWTQWREVCATDMHRISLHMGKRCTTAASPCLSHLYITYSESHSRYSHGIFSLWTVSWLSCFISFLLLIVFDCL